MNYLAHAYLSFNDPQILAGNMFSDFIRGKKKFDYPHRIQQGIALHRAIDTFTDDHIHTRAAKKIFQPAYRLYAGAFVDVVYDHFLALDDGQFAAGGLSEFANGTYILLDELSEHYPERFRMLYPYMKKQNWLGNYQYKWMIAKSFEGLAHRAKYINETKTANLLFEENYNYLRECYTAFFPALKNFTVQRLQQLL